jgi:hypothetical protein
MDAAPEPRGHREREVVRPAGVVQIVLVEVDRAVLLRGPRPVHLGAGPVEARHRPRRAVHGLAVEPVGGAVGDALGGDVGSQVPRRHHRGLEPGRPGGLDEGGHLGARERAVRRARAVDLAVEVGGGAEPPGHPGRIPRPPGRHQERARAQAGRERDRARDLDRRLGAEREAPDALLPERDRARGGIPGERHEVPAPLGERGPGGDPLDAPAAVSQDGRQRPALVERQGHAGARRLRPGAEDRLGAVARPGRPHQGLEGEALEGGEDRRGGDDHVGPGAGLLPPTRVLLAGGMRDDLGPEARRVGAGLGGQEAHQVGPVAGQPVAAHPDGEPVARLEAHAVAVGQDRRAVEVRPRGGVPARRLGLAQLASEVVPRERRPAELEHRPLGCLEAGEDVPGDELGEGRLADHPGEHPLGVGPRHEQAVGARRRVPAQAVQDRLEVGAVDAERAGPELAGQVEARRVDREHVASPRGRTGRPAMATPGGAPRRHTGQEE